MPTVKTAISVPSDLFKQMDRLSRKLRIPRSRLFALAVREFIERRQAAEITQRLNQVYGQGESDEDVDFRHAANRALNRSLEKYK